MINLTSHNFREMMLRYNHNRLIKSVNWKETKKPQNTILLLLLIPNRKIFYLILVL